MSSLFSRLLIFAQEAVEKGAQEVADAADAAGDPAAADGGFFGGLSFSHFLPLIAIIGLLFYFVVLRPGQDSEAEKRTANLKKNDKVETIGGIMGVVTNVTEKYITLRVDENANTKMKLRRTAIARVLSDEDDEADADSTT